MRSRSRSRRGGRAPGPAPPAAARRPRWARSPGRAAPPGPGKSSLRALPAGLDVPTRGRVLLAGQDLTQLDEDGRARVRAQRVGFVFQAFHLIPSLTALDHVMLPLELPH